MTASQNKQIFTALLHGATLTPQDALSMCGCFRLSARVADLKEIGCDIVNDAPLGHYASYRLAGFAPWTTEEEVTAKLTGKGGAA